MSYIDRAEAIQRIRKSLRARTGRAWRVCGNRGTAYDWINVKAPKDRAVGEYGDLNDEDARMLGEIFRHDRPTHHQGESISPDSREWAVACAEGRTRPGTDEERRQDPGLRYVICAGEKVCGKCNALLPADHRQFLLANKAWICDTCRPNEAGTTGLTAIAARMAAQS